MKYVNIKNIRWFRHKTSKKVRVYTAYSKYASWEPLTYGLKHRFFFLTRYFVCLYYPLDRTLSIRDLGHCNRICHPVLFLCHANIIGSSLRHLLCPFNTLHYGDKYSLSDVDTIWFMFFCIILFIKKNIYNAYLLKFKEYIVSLITPLFINCIHLMFLQYHISEVYCIVKTVVFLLTALLTSNSKVKHFVTKWQILLVKFNLIF